MDKAIKRGLERIKKVTSKEEKSLIKQDIKRDKRCDVAEKMAKNWIADAVKNKGSLHKSLKIPQGEKIPASKIKKAEHSKNPKLAKKAHLAETLSKLRKK